MATTTTEYPRVLSASTLENEKVVNAAGESLGRIEDYMIDLNNGRIAYCVLSFGGFLGMGDKLFAIPWQAMTLDTVNKCFILNVDKSRLKNAPGFDKDDWPDTNNPEWGTRIYKYYNVRPYWE
ncbi:MAG TPA: PRC-barrel domain-containing protein [Thermoanaerobaculia bacterium]|nr:PRC-barrel domain-containing protein [Thermoanaerobaculia bacterium]